MLVLVGLTASPKAHADIELKVGRFFDPCIISGVTIEQANGEACIIQAILNEFSAKENGITVDLLASYGSSYYPQLIASYSSNTPPDVHLLHRHRLQDFANAGLLAPLGDDFSSVGIDVEDWEPAAVDAVSVGGDILAMPFDLHANLWHVNRVLLREAGLLGPDGRPILPSSPGELIDHAKMVKQITGKDYLAADFTQFPIGMRAVLSLLWQQGRNIIEGADASINTAEMRAAITTFTDLFDAGLAKPTYDYEEAQQAFLDGEVAVLINGTWAVDLYDRMVARGESALVDYDVTDFPTLFLEPATWADLHVWAIPAKLANEDEEKYAAALELLAWINDHNLDWARTGHLAVRTSVLESLAYRTMAHRPDYQQSITLGHDIPITINYGDIQSVLMETLPTIWRDGRSLEQVLPLAEDAIQDLVQ